MVKPAALARKSRARLTIAPALGGEQETARKSPAWWCSWRLGGEIGGRLAVGSLPGQIWTFRAPGGSDSVSLPPAGRLALGDDRRRLLVLARSWPAWSVRGQVVRISTQELVTGRPGHHVCSSHPGRGRSPPNWPACRRAPGQSLHQERQADGCGFRIDGRGLALLAWIGGQVEQECAPWPGPRHREIEGHPPAPIVTAAWSGSPPGELLAAGGARETRNALRGDSDGFSRQQERDTRSNAGRLALMSWRPAAGVLIGAPGGAGDQAAAGCSRPAWRPKVWKPYL